MFDQPDDNPYMRAQTLEQLREMEAALYQETWKGGKIIPEMEDYYKHQMDLFTEAFATLFPDDYDFHKKTKRP